MAGSLTTLNAYFNAKKMHPKPKGNSRFHLGKQHEWYTASLSRLKGGWDEAVENNFKTCFHRKKMRANSTSMGNCLNELLSESRCDFGPSDATSILNQLSKVNSVSALQCSFDEKCTSSQVVQPNDSVQDRIAFIQNQFSNPDSSKILPITMAWDTGAADGDIQDSFNHVSNIIGRRILPNGSCQLLVRNSYSNFCVENKDYPYGKCNAPGKTDDFWIDADRLIHHSGDYTTLNL